jgi:hypothetical protein
MPAPHPDVREVERKWGLTALVICLYTY